VKKLWISCARAAGLGRSLAAPRDIDDDGDTSAVCVPCRREGSAASYDARSLLAALWEVAEHCESVWPVVADGARELTLGDAAHALMHVNDVLDATWQWVGPFVKQVEQIRERDFIPRKGTGLDTLDAALVHLECGRDGVQLARHVLGLAHVTLADVPSGTDETGDPSA